MYLLRMETGVDPRLLTVLVFTVCYWLRFYDRSW